MLELISLFLQTMGLIIILVSQAIFYLRTRREWGSLKKGFLSLTRPRDEREHEALLVLSQNQLNKTFKLFPLAKFLYDDFVISVIGLLCALIGTLLPFAFLFFLH